jgi:hypothetical protein
MEKTKMLITKGYLAYKNILSKKDGASTIEYVIVLAAAAAFAGLLSSILGGGEVKGKITKKIMDALN